MSWEEVTVLVGRAQSGDRAAYGELVRRFQGSVYAMALTRVHEAPSSSTLKLIDIHASSANTATKVPNRAANPIIRGAMNVAFPRTSLA